MIRFCNVVALLSCALLPLAEAQTPSTARTAPYQPAVAAPTANVYGGGWGGYSSPGTAAGSAMQGMSQVISSAGQYNLNTSAAAINWTQAESNAMQNKVQATNTFWETRNIYKSQRDAELAEARRHLPSPEEAARLARQRVPNGLTPSQLDPVSGRVNWPDALQAPVFDDQRKDADAGFAKLVSQNGLTYTERASLREVLDSMFDNLKGQIASVPPQDYVASRTFLQSAVFTVAHTFLN